MIVDFHTHVFPDKIAQKTIAHLSRTGNVLPVSDGTVAGLLREMEAANAAVAVNLPVLTAPAQFESVTRFAMEINAAFADHPRRLISFGGIHPACEDIDGKMRDLRQKGFLGVKIHPDYQDTFITDEGYVRILQCAKEYDMVVVTHAGVDSAYRHRAPRCTPALAKELIRRVPHNKFVLAHLGGNEQFGEVLQTLCGEDVYLDTSFVLRYVTPALFGRILERHGDDRILFASDSPWSSIASDAKILRSFSLGKDTEEKLFYKNAQKLLEIER